MTRLQKLCPNNSYEPLGLSNYISNTAQSAQNNCPGFGGANWESTFDAQCPAQGVPADAGYLDPLSLPANFPPTTALSNIPGSVTALSQYKVTSSALTVTWNEFGTSTYVFSAYDAAAAVTTAPAQSFGVITGSSGAIALTTAAGTAGSGGAANTQTTGATTGTNTASAAQTSKTSGAERITVPGAVGLLSLLLML